MIYSLNGLINHKSKNFIVVDVNGIGYIVFVTDDILNSDLNINDRINLYTYMCVRENDISLYGFKNFDEREFFSILLNISGIGPKTALAVLSKYDSIKLSRILVEKDIESLVKIPGIGRKTAERMILELKEKAGINLYNRELDINSECDMENVVKVLCELGCSSQDAKKAVQTAIQTVKTNDFEEILSESLKFIKK